MKNQSDKIFCENCRFLHEFLSGDSTVMNNCRHEVYFKDTSLSPMSERKMNYNHVNMNMNNDCNYFEVKPTAGSFLVKIFGKRK